MKRAILAIGLALALFCQVSLPAMAGITWETRGQAKVGSLILGTTPITATGAELNTVKDQIASVSQVSTPATGTNGTQFTFKNAAGGAVAGRRDLLAYLSDASGNQTAAGTSLVVLTNGQLTQLVTGKTALCTTTAAGLLGVTLTASAGSYFMSFVLPNGKPITSTVLTVN